MVLLWILLFTCLIYCFFFRQSKLRLPGPIGLPILGNVLQIDPKQSHLTMMKWAQKYGDVFVVNMFRDQVVFVNDYDTIYEVLVKRGDEFSDRGKFYRLELFSRGWKDIVFSSSSSPHWKILRQASHKYIKMHAVAETKTVELLLDEAVQTHMQKFAKYEGEPFDVRQHIFEFTVWITYILLFGERLEPNSETSKNIRDIIEAFDANTSLVGSGKLLDVFPWLRLFPNKVYSNLLRANEALDVFWDKHKMKFLTMKYEEQPECLIKHLLNLKNNLKPDIGVPILDDINIEVVVLDLLFGGTATTTASLSNFLLLLLHYPDVQQKLQDEVDAIVGRYNKVTLADRYNMPYTRAAIYELLRYASVLHSTLHAASKDTIIKGAFIPKGNKVVINLWHLHHEEDFWGDPWSYRPERYLDENGDLLAADHPNRKRMLAFGAGPRVCLGEVFALNRMFLFIASLAQRFDVSMDTTKHLPSCDPRTYVTDVVLHPPDISVSMVPRANRQA